MRNVCGIIILDARSAQEARKLTEDMKNCPYLLASGTTGKTVYSIYIKPEDQRWWLKYPESHPEVTGAEAAHVHIVDELTRPDDFAPRTPTSLTVNAPCGADCSSCSLRDKYGCPGCPATTHYRGRIGSRRHP